MAERAFKFWIGRKVGLEAILEAASKSRTPHSLGKLIEWKLETEYHHTMVNQLPTRWGN